MRFSLRYGGVFFVPPWLTLRAAMEWFICRSFKVCIRYGSLFSNQAYPSTWFAATLYDGTVRLGLQIFVDLSPVLRCIFPGKGLQPHFRATFER